MKIKQFVKKHKGALVCVALSGVFLYLVLRKGKADPEDAESVISVWRELLPGEDPVEVAKSLMGPDTVVTVSKGIFSAAMDFAIPGKDYIKGFLLQ